METIHRLGFIWYGVPHVSFWFYHYLLFLVICFISYSYVVGNNTTDVRSRINNITQELFTLFANNQMKANHDKCHLLLSSHEQAYA